MDAKEHLIDLLAAQELPSWWKSKPSWLRGGFEMDGFAIKCEQVQGVPFLLTGRRPAVGQRLSLQIHYDHDGSHPEAYRGWAMMVGEVTKILPPPPAGVYGNYIHQAVELSKEELNFLRSNMPKMPPSLNQACKCGFEHTLESALERGGAAHGQALLAKIRLSCDDAGDLEPQLSGYWDAMFVHNDTRQYCWELRAMKRSEGL